MRHLLIPCVQAASPWPALTWRQRLSEQRGCSELLPGEKKGNKCVGATPRCCCAGKIPKLALFWPCWEGSGAADAGHAPRPPVALCCSCVCSDGGTGSLPVGCLLLGASLLGALLLEALLLGASRCWHTVARCHTVPSAVTCVRPPACPRRGSWKALVFANCCFGWIFSSYCYGNCN